MRIRYLVADAYVGGGINRATFTTASALAQRHRVEIISVVRRRNRAVFALDPRVRLRPLVDLQRPAPDGRAGKPLLAGRPLVTDRALQRASLLIHPEDARYPLFSLLTDVQLVRFLRSVRHGVLVATSPGLSIAVARFARGSVVRVAQEHGPFPRVKQALIEQRRRYYPRLDAVAALSPVDARRYRTLLGDGAKVVAIPNPAPDMGGVRSTLDSKVVMAAGRLVADKGFDRLLEAFAAVVPSHPDWQLRIFGRGEQAVALARQIDELGIAGNARLMSYSRQLPQEYGRASIFVLTSRYEGLPMVVLEALSCGLPVVGFDSTAGVRQLVNSGVNGLLVPNGDVGRLTSALLELIESDEMRRAFGAAALEVAAQYTAPEVARRWERLFKRCAADRRAHR